MQERRPGEQQNVLGMESNASDLALGQAGIDFQQYYGNGAMASSNHGASGTTSVSTTVMSNGNGYHYTGNGNGYANTNGASHGGKIHPLQYNGAGYADETQGLANGIVSKQEEWGAVGQRTPSMFSPYLFGNGKQFAEDAPYMNGLRPTTELKMKIDGTSNGINPNYRMSIFDTNGVNNGNGNANGFIGDPLGDFGQVTGKNGESICVPIVKNGKSCYESAMIAKYEESTPKIENTKIERETSSYSAEAVGSSTKKSKSRSSRFRGVSKNGNQWQAIIMVNNKKRYVGSYSTEAHAAKAYDLAAIQNHGDKAKTNFSYTLEELAKIRNDQPILGRK
eukprot:TRINITY_DN7227_c0_g3_i1.p1 TRINITY_DN7227_c0_g3~~TRINITY_DN7227_c0_g3_i1.p1  ORF type:complete len:336 (+),score=27.41 TRINITY_DN7227_c0_g3_i1:1-1008(+)